MFKREDQKAFKILIDELGLVSAIRIGARVQRKVFTGEPFEELPEPDSEDERLSRQQIGPAIVLYRELKEKLTEERAYEVTERVVVEASVVFLSKTVGRLRRRELLSMGDAEREAFVREKGEKFFNANLSWDRIDADAVEFTVLHCKFPPLCEAVGEPELAPVFCKGDAEFFGGVEEDVDLERPHTIAEGGPNCPFHIYLRDGEE